MCRTIPRIFYSATGWGKGSSVLGVHRISRGRQPRRNGPTTRAEAPFSRKPSAVHFKPRQRPAHRPSPPRVGVGPGFYWPVWRTTLFPIVRCRGGALEWGGCVGRQFDCAGFQINLKPPGPTRANRFSSSALFLLPPHAPCPPPQHACDRLIHESTPANGAARFTNGACQAAHNAKGAGGRAATVDPGS